MSIWDQFAQEGRRLVMVNCSLNFNMGIIQRVCACICERRVQHVILYGSGAQSFKSHLRNDLIREHPDFPTEILVDMSERKLFKDKPTYQEHSEKFWWGKDPEKGDFAFFIA